MTKLKTTKKPAQKDWHRADIVAALHKAGWSLRKLSMLHGYRSPSTLVHALDKSWPKGERIIAEAIGIDPAIIWPSRYVIAINGNKRRRFNTQNSIGCGDE